MQRWLPLVIFVVILGFARIVGAMVPSFGNLQPLGALFFCGMACFGVRWIWVPALVWVATLIPTSGMQGYAWNAQLLVVVAGYAAMVGLGKVFQGRKAGALFFGSLLSALAFYVITNTFSWAFEPAYAKSLGGWVQALTVGLPAYSPTWTFFVKSLVSQAVCTGAFLAAYGYLKAPSLWAPQSQEA